MEVLHNHRGHHDDDKGQKGEKLLTLQPPVPDEGHGQPGHYIDGRAVIQGVEQLSVHIGAYPVHQRDAVNPAGEGVHQEQPHKEGGGHHQ